MALKLLVFLGTSIYGLEYIHSFLKYLQALTNEYNNSKIDAMNSSSIEAFKSQYGREIKFS